MVMLTLDDISDVFSINDAILFFRMDNCSTCSTFSKLLGDMNFLNNNKNFYFIDFNINNPIFVALTKLFSVNYYPALLVIKNGVVKDFIDAVDFEEGVFMLIFKILNSQKSNAADLPSVRGEEACKNFLKEFLTKELV
jgi:hypothetical protein